MRLDEQFIYPPITHTFSWCDQREDDAWDALTAFARTWNREHKNLFVVDEEEIFVTLADGVRDAERAALERALDELQRSHGCCGIEGIESRYKRPEDYASADFVAILGDGCAQGFIANEIEAWGPPLTCEACGREGRDPERRVLGPLVVNEEILTRSLEAHAAQPPDLISLRNGVFLASKQLVDQLTSFGARGFSLSEVLCADSQQPSKKYFLLSATTAVVTPCPTHTPMTSEPCVACGSGGGNLLSEVYIEEPLLRDRDLFSRHRYGFSDLYFSRELYQHLVAAGTVGMLTTGALDRCRHEPAPQRARAAVVVTSRFEASKISRPRCSVDTFMRFVRSSRLTARCRGRGRHGSDITLTLENMIEPGADAIELNALEQRFADVAHLRPLALQADGILLFHQAGGRPSRFPTRAAIQETEGAVCVPAALQFEKVCDWSFLRAEMQEESRMHDTPFLAAYGVPFATIVGASDRLVCADGRIYYFSSLGGGRYHNQVIANDLPELLGLITTDLARFLQDSAAVTTYYDDDGQQYYPRGFFVDA